MIGGMMKRPKRRDEWEETTSAKIQFDSGYNQAYDEWEAYYYYILGQLPDEKEMIEIIIQYTQDAIDPNYISGIAKAIHDRLRGSDEI